MNKAAIALGSVLCLGSLLVIGGATLSGRTARAALSKQSASLKRSFPELELDEQFDVGLFTSTRRLRVKLGCVPAPTGGERVPIELVWEDQIAHGPLPGGQGVGLARVRSTLLAPPAFAKEVAAVLGDAPLLALDTRLGFDGRFTADVQLPQVVLRDARLGSFSMSALTGRVVGGVSPDATRLEYSLSSPGVRLELRAEGTESKLDLGEIRAEGAGQLAGDDGHFLLPSHTAGSVASTTWSSAMPGVGPISASFRNARYESDSTLADGLWSTSTKTTAEGSIQGIALDKLESAGAIKRLHAATLEGLVHKAIGTLLSCDAATAALGPLALLGELDSAARELLPHNPEYAIGPVAVELGGKRAELSYSLGVRGVEAADAAQPPLAIAMQKGVVRAEAKLSIGLLDELVKLAAGPLSSYGALPGVSPQAAQAAASDPAQMVAFAHLLVDQAVGEGYLRRNGDELSAVAELAAGELSVNGKPVSLPSIDTPTAP